MIRMRYAKGFGCGVFIAIAFAANAPAQKSLDNSMTRVEESLYRDLAEMPVDGDLARTQVYDYLPAPHQHPGWGFLPKAYPHATKCLPAAGKEICGVVDARHQILALTHHGCCNSNIFMRYDGPPLGLTDVDLSAVRTHLGISLGTTAAQIAKIFGKPKVYRGVNTGRAIYGYFYQAPTKCPVYSMKFVFGRERRVDTMLYGFDC